MGATITENVIWTAENNEQRIVLRAKNGRYYPQRYIIGEHGPDWYFEPEFKGYKTLAGAKKSLKSCTLVARASFKTSNAVIYVIKGEEKSYHVTIINGKATGCCHADDNETCTGFSYRKTCGHVKLALAAEEKRIEEMCEAIALAPIIVGEQFEDEVAVFDVEPIQLVTGSCNSCGNPTKRAFCAGCAGVAA